MARISREQMFMEIAHTVAKRGTCPRASVGAVIVRDGRVVSIGYNGAPPGQKHCEEVGCENPSALKGHILDKVNAELVGCQRATHAELNAIMFAARSGIATDDSEMYCTHASCIACARAITTSGISKFIYEIPYRLTDGLEFLDRSLVVVRQYCVRETIEQDGLRVPWRAHSYVRPKLGEGCVRCGKLPEAIGHVSR